MQPLITDKKRKPLTDVTNLQYDCISDNEDTLRWGKFNEAHWFLLQPATHVEDVPKRPEQFKMQNTHPHLALYGPTMQTDFLSHDNLCVILNSEDETALLKLRTETGVIAKSQQCKFCGAMHHENQGEIGFGFATEESMAGNVIVASFQYVTGHS